MLGPISHWTLQDAVFSLRLVVTRARSAYGLLACVLCVGWAVRASAEVGGQPRTFVWDLHNLAVAKQAWHDGNRVISADVERLLTSAKQNLTAGPFSVTFTPEVAPSGDPHDLVSYGYYCWPNPDTPSGVPWVCRDGFGNPDSEVDWKQVYGLARASESLSLAYYFTEDERYAEKLASLLRVFFLDEQTRMNPRIEYSDVIPGKSSGSYGVPGIGNAFGVHKMMDGAGIIEASPHWTAADREGLQKWARDFNYWAETSPKGAVQRNEPSNHGTNYDFVATVLALYAGDLEEAERHYSYYALNRMPGQIAADGSNPLEMKRANNLLYHRYNLGRAFNIAALGNKMDTFDLFTHEMSDGRGLRLALDYITPYLVGDQTWDKWPGAPFSRELPQVYYELLRRAAAFYHDPSVLETANRLGQLSISYIDLTHPEAIVFENFWKGDANLDGEFNSADMVQVFQQGKYNGSRLASWADGDWNSDRLFDSGDLIVAMQQGRYERGPGAISAAQSVPEPSACQLLLVGLMATAWRHRRHRAR